MQGKELPERTATAAELADEHARFVQARKPRLDGSIHDDRVPAPPAPPAFVSTRFPRLSLDHVVIFDMTDSGTVVLKCGDVSIHLHSEEQAQALITAAGRAAAMFAAAKAPQPLGIPADVLTAVVETNARLLAVPAHAGEVMNPTTHLLEALPQQVVKA